MAFDHNEIIPPSAPRMGNAVTRAIGRLILKLVGWKMVGKLPDENKLVIIGAPHTSNLDFILAMGCMLSLGLKFSFMMKKEAFFFPLSGLFKALGGIPITRSKKSNLTEQMGKWFNDHDKVWLGITPEGTRSKTEHFKKGYLYIAQAANVPVFIVGINSPTKQVFLDKVWPLTGDLDADNAAIEAYFKQKYTGVKPENQ